MIAKVGRLISFNDADFIDDACDDAQMIDVIRRQRGMLCEVSMLNKTR